MASPDLKVVVPTAGRPTLLERTLRSLAACHRPECFSETIVVGNGPECGARRVVADAAGDLRARYLHVSQPNKSQALNDALAGLDDRTLIYFIDDDIRLAPEVLQRYADAAAGTFGGAFFGGPFGVDYEVAPPEWLLSYLPASAQGWQPQPSEIVAGNKLYFLGFNWAAFVGDLRAGGMFDPRFGPGGTSGGRGQEYDMQVRLYEAGLGSHFVPAARVWHYVSRERCSESFAVTRRYQSEIYFGRKAPCPDVPLLLGMPRYRVRRWFRYFWRYLLALRLRDRRARFDARYDLARYTGMLQGMRQASRERRAAAAHSPDASRNGTHADPSRS